MGNQCRTRRPFSNSDAEVKEIREVTKNAIIAVMNQTGEIIKVFVSNISCAVLTGPCQWTYHPAIEI